MDRSLQGLPPITRSKGPHSCICKTGGGHSQRPEGGMEGGRELGAQPQWPARGTGGPSPGTARTCFWVTLRTSPTYMILP